MFKTIRRTSAAHFHSIQCLFLSFGIYINKRVERRQWKELQIAENHLFQLSISWKKNFVGHRRDGNGNSHGALSIRYSTFDEMGKILIKKIDVCKHTSAQLNVLWRSEHFWMLMQCRTHWVTSVKICWRIQSRKNDEGNLILFTLLNNLIK